MKHLFQTEKKKQGAWPREAWCQGVVLTHMVVLGLVRAVVVLCGDGVGQVKPQWLLTLGEVELTSQVGQLATKSKVAQIAACVILGEIIFSGFLVTVRVRVRSPLALHAKAALSRLARRVSLGRRGVALGGAAAV